jgi:nicotinamidase/pyrazinamidase
MLRLSTMIQKGLHGLTSVIITLDTHQRRDIAHPTFWMDAQGSTVPPFTSITAQQVRQGQFQTQNPTDKTRALDYLDTLESQGRYTLMVWPVHCEVGTWGHRIHAAIQSSCHAWEENAGTRVQYIHKGTNPWTEHYSAIQAEVPDDSDPKTQLNHRLVNHLDQAEWILIAGEASSHCVKATTEHLVEHLPSGALERIVLLTDCMSPVPGFERQSQQFFENMRTRGVQCSTSTEVLVWLMDKG